MPERAFISPAALTYDEAADYLGINRRTLQRLVRDGRVRVVRPAPNRPRFRPEDLDAYLESTARGGTRRKGRAS